MRILSLLLGAAMMMTSPALATENSVQKPAPVQFSEQYVMLYYKDIRAASAFYGTVLGLQKTFSDDWVHLYKATPQSFIGLVREGPGAFFKAKSDNAVMVSLVTGDVDGLYAKIKDNKSITVLGEPNNHDGAPIRGFMVRDPGGYVIEFFSWIKPAAKP